MISTAVEKVAINFNKPDQQWLDRMTLAEAKQYLAEGHFAAGSMAPKIEAIISFLENGGPKAIITQPGSISRHARRNGHHGGAGVAGRGHSDDHRATMRDSRTSYSPATSSTPARRGLAGTLDVLYDYDALRATVTRSRCRSAPIRRCGASAR